MSECNDAYVAIGGPEGVILIGFVRADTKNGMDGKMKARMRENGRQRIEQRSKSSSDDLV